MICPIMSKSLVVHDGETDLEMQFVECQKENCMLWTMVYTTERTQQIGCSLELNPHMNSEGQYRV